LITLIFSPDVLLTGFQHAETAQSLRTRVVDLLDLLQRLSAVLSSTDTAFIRFSPMLSQVQEDVVALFSRIDGLAVALDSLSAQKQIAQPAVPIRVVKVVPAKPSAAYPAPPGAIVISKPAAAYPAPHGAVVIAKPGAAYPAPPGAVVIAKPAAAYPAPPGAVVIGKPGAVVIAKPAVPSLPVQPVEKPKLEDEKDIEDFEDMEEEEEDMDAILSKMLFDGEDALVS
jgi:hypothetical protein